MNQENAKDFLPLIQALEEGKTIQIRDGDYWFDVEDVSFSYEAKDYRIKSEVEYVSFATVEELIDYWVQKRFDDYTPYHTGLELPLIWVKNKLLSNSKFLITGYEGGTVYLDGMYYSMINMFEDFTFLDGSPIGKIKE